MFLFLLHSLTLIPIPYFKGACNRTIAMVLARQCLALQFLKKYEKALFLGFQSLLSRKRNGKFLNPASDIQNEKCLLKHHGTTLFAKPMQGCHIRCFQIN